LFFGFARGEFLLVVGLFFGISFVRSSFDFGFGLGNGGKSLFATRQFSRYIQAIREVSSVGLCSMAQKVFNFSFELPFELASVLPTQSPVLGGVGFDLGPIKTDFAKLQNFHTVSDLKNLDEE